MRRAFPTQAPLAPVPESDDDDDDDDEWVVPQPVVRFEVVPELADEFPEGLQLVRLLRLPAPLPAEETVNLDSVGRLHYARSVAFEVGGGAGRALMAQDSRQADRRTYIQTKRRTDKQTDT
jgi:hypothetical protein